MKNSLPHLHNHVPQEDITLQGQVAEIIEQEQKQFLKIMFAPFSCTIQNQSDFHLGDHVEVEASISVKRVKSEFEVP